MLSNQKVRIQNGRRLTLKPLGRLALATSIGLASASLMAGDAQTEGFTLNPSVGLHTQPGGDAGLSDTLVGSLAVGYQFASPWALELAYTLGSPELKVVGSDTDLDQYRVDALYHFAFQDDVQPYLVMGLGKSEYSLDGFSFDQNIANLGLGIKKSISDSVSVRTDLRAVYGDETETTQTAFNFGLHILLGAKPAKSTKVVPTVSESIQEPAVAVSLDDDGDGVLNADDNCPETSAGAKVDEFGCYLILKEDVSVTLDVKFENNSDEVLASSYAEVERLAQFMREFPNSEVEIKGHTDDRGAAAYNKSLSQKRAAAVAAILELRHGVDGARINAVGYGEEQPIATNDTAEGRAANRRVEALMSATREKIVK